MTPDLIAWLTAPEDVCERRARIAEYLANEGYELPPSPPDADYGEAGAIHRVRGQEMPVGDSASALQVAEGESEECTSEADH